MTETLTCPVCGSEKLEWDLVDDGVWRCGDPECCGSPAFYRSVTCEDCKGGFVSSDFSSDLAYPVDKKEVIAEWRELKK